MRTTNNLKSYELQVKAVTVPLESRARDTFSRARPRPLKLRENHKNESRIHFAPRNTLRGFPCSVFIAKPWRIFSPLSSRYCGLFTGALRTTVRDDRTSGSGQYGDHIQRPTTNSNKLVAMPSYRSRSRSPEPDLPNNASPISESDYFLKSSEFRIWLKDEKGKVSAFSKTVSMAHNALFQILVL
jgi:hypothetical protein